MADFLLELLCEEIPARMQAGARGELEKLFRRELDAAGVTAGEITVWSTPRRLALIARDVPERTPTTEEEVKGPPVGAPDQAIDGFCKKNDISREMLEVKEIKGRPTYVFLDRRPGGDVREALGVIIPAIIRDFSWPKSMRWGAASITTDSLRWVRPLSGLVALLDGEVVPCEVDGISSGRETFGHRFHSAGAISIASADDYAASLRAAHVIVAHEERAGLIREGAARAAADAGLTLVADEGLVVENAGLTEWPVPLLGRFDEAFLDVPPEVIQLTARVNQKYFVCQSSPSGEGDHAQHGGGAGAADGKLANAFVCTANIAPRDPAVVVDGNRKVLAARLSDARFFWEQDQKTPLAVHAEKLVRITFHEKLGTVADKVERVAKLARWLVESDIVTPAKAGVSGGDALLPEMPASAGMTREVLADMAEQAARLCKADLVTEMVGEFPELQGLMGGYYAAKEGLPVEVSDAIRDHYKPVGQGDEVPTAPVTVAVSLADKLDTLVGFLRIGEGPTGSRDPFALRRAALGCIGIMQTNDIKLRLVGLVEKCVELYRPQAFQRAFDQSPVLSDLDLPKAPKIFKLKSQLNDGKAVTTFTVDGIEAGPFQHDAFDVFMESLFVWHGYQPDFSERFIAFFADRLKVQQREAGVRHDLIDAVFALGGEDDLVRLLARVHALQAFVTTEDGANLLAGYKRAANILRKEGWSDTEATRIPRTGEEDPMALVDDPAMAEIIAEQAALRANAATPLSYTPDPAEKALIDALATAAPLAVQAVEAERFADAMAALATLRAPIDRFFEEVTVNDADANKRAARLALLAAFRDAVHKVADFSRIEG